MATSVIQPKGNGTETYYELWRNTSPNESFSAQTISNLPDLQQYDGIQIVWRRGSATVDLDNWENDVNAFRCIFDLRNGQYANYGRTGTGAMFVIAVQDGDPSTNGGYARSAYINTNTSIRFASCFKLTSSSASAINSECVPLVIRGVVF